MAQADLPAIPLPTCHIAAIFRKIKTGKRILLLIVTNLAVLALVGLVFASMIALITLSEGWHNNHHHYPASVRQGFYWWEFDMTFYMLKLMSFCGLIWDLNPVPAAVREGGGKRWR